MYPDKLLKNLVIMLSVFILVILVLSLSGVIGIPSCSSKYQVGWYGSDGVNYMRYQFEYFEGEESKTIFIKRPCNISLKYNVSVHNGKLELKLVSPSGKVVWKKEIVDASIGRENIRLNETGCYRIVVHGESARGRFDISWCVT